MDAFSCSQAVTDPAIYFSIDTKMRAYAWRPSFSAK
jgi:hypothetical protein